MSEVTHGQTGTASTVETGTAPAADTTAADRVVAAHLSDIRLAVDTLRHCVQDPDMLRLAELLDGAHGREVEYLAGETDPKRPLPGEEAWLAWAIAGIFLGQVVPHA